MSRAELAFGMKRLSSRTRRLEPTDGDEVNDAAIRRQTKTGPQQNAEDRLMSGQTLATD